ncbi:MAG: vitamin K epoxide reductase family protein [Gemmatimonadota bacterium]|nr:vitamin K epoxide reductase family protein [Gemmatimonadota bacterium]
MTPALWIARALAFLGFLDAAWLTASHLAGRALACGPTEGCEVVLTSRYATIGDVPVAAVGAAYYAVASLIAWTPGRSWSRGLALVFVGLEGVAVAISAVLVWIQWSVVGAWCPFCLVSAGLTLGLFVCALALVAAHPVRP